MSTFTCPARRASFEAAQAVLDKPKRRRRHAPRKRTAAHAGNHGNQSADRLAPAVTRPAP